MRWFISAVFIFGALSMVLAAPEPAEDGLIMEALPKSMIFNVGEKKAFYCKVKNNEGPIEWYSPRNEKIEKKKVRNPRISSENTTTKDSPGFVICLLIINRAEFIDAGNWTCKVDNHTDTVEVIVGEKVVIPDNNVSVIKEDHDSAKFECEAKGNPEPDVHWKKNNINIVADKKKYVMKKKDNLHTLEIKNLNHTDAGEYVCKVTQEILSHYADKHFHLTVEHKPVLINPFTQEAYSTYRVQEIYAIINETKNITCSAIATPPPTFSWYKREKSFDYPVTNADIFNDENGSYSVLTLNMYNESYLGQYKCMANNTKGQNSILFHVSLGNKPNPPDNMRFESATNESLAFYVNCSTCKMVQEEGEVLQPENLVITGFTFQLVPVKEGVTLADWESDRIKEETVGFENSINNTIFNVTGLSNKTKYYVRVCTRNAAGCSEWFDFKSTPSTNAGVLNIVAQTTMLIFLYVLTFIN